VIVAGTELIRIVAFNAINSSWVVRGSLNAWRILNKLVEIEPKPGLDRSRLLNQTNKSRR
jgi:hypothetical protein